MSNYRNPQRMSAHITRLQGLVARAYQLVLDASSKESPIYQDLLMHQTNHDGLEQQLNNEVRRFNRQTCAIKDAAHSRALRSLAAMRTGITYARKVQAPYRAINSMV